MPKKIRNCRGCGRAVFFHEDVFKLEPQYIATYFVGAGAEVPTWKRFPLQLLECQGCHLVQLWHTVDRELLFRDYWYRSSISQTMRDHLQRLAEEATELAELVPGDRIVDIGANDGTLLSYFPPVMRKVAYEPSQFALSLPPEIEVHREFFPEACMAWPGPPRLITAIATFYSVEEPQGFLKSAHAVLAQDGLLCIEVADWPKLMRMGAFDTICHEHLFYFSLGSLVELARSCHFEPITVRFTPLNGASLRVYFQLEGGPRSPEVDFDSLISQERLVTPPWSVFTGRAQTVCDEVLEFLLEKQVQGVPVSLLGASTKGNVFLQAAGIHHGLVLEAEERDQRKWGLKTLGTGIPIVPEGTGETTVKLVMPWHFLPEIVEREMDFLTRGGEIVCSLPTFRRITIENWKEKAASFKLELAHAS